MSKDLNFTKKDNDDDFNYLEWHSFGVKSTFLRYIFFPSSLYFRMTSQPEKYAFLLFPPSIFFTKHSHAVFNETMTPKRYARALSSRLDSVVAY